MRPPIATPAELEERLAEPTAAVLELFRNLEGDILLLGVAGKLGPSLARMALRATRQTGATRRIFGVSRFSDPREEARLKSDGIETLRCDLLDEPAVARLPDAPNIIYLAGMKFGSSGNEPLTWAMNTHLPAVICRRYPRSRIVAYSTGNVYGMVATASGGSRETDPPQPVGEYAMSCLGRERIFEHFSGAHGLPVALLRLNYACDLRYGVLVDIARRVWERQPVDLPMGWFNTIWQGDSNALTLLALAQTSSPARILNLTGPELLSVREVALTLGRLLAREVRFHGQEGPTALLSNTGLCRKVLGPTQVNAKQLLHWVADWIKNGGSSLGKPTHFEVRDGRY